MAAAGLQVSNGRRDGPRPPRRSRGRYQLTRHTSCAVRAGLCVDVMRNGVELLGLIVFGKLSALVALKISALNSNRARPGSWNDLARRKSISPNHRPMNRRVCVPQSPV